MRSNWPTSTHLVGVPFAVEGSGSFGSGLTRFLTARGEAVYEVGRRWHQPTIDYIARRRADGKSSREANRCLKRYLARHLYRILEHPPIAT